MEGSQEDKEVKKRMNTLDEGAYQAVYNCLRLRDDENVVLITDSYTLDIAAAILSQVKRFSRNVRMFVAEDIGKRPLKSVPDELSDAMKISQVGILAMQSWQGELENFRRPLLQSVHADMRFANMININRRIMEDAMCADYRMIKDFSMKVYDLVKDAQQIYVRSPAGTDLVAEFSPDMNWVIGDGIIEPGTWSNLPDGEVYTCPANINGTLVVDGVLGDYFASEYGTLAENPLTVVIKNSRIKDVHSSNLQLAHEFEKRVKMDENSDRVGEFAIGTNYFIRNLIGNLLQDEKFPGVHVAFGHPYPERTNSGWHSSVHIDAVILKPSIYVDGKNIMEAGDFRL